MSCTHPFGPFLLPESHTNFGVYLKGHAKEDGGFSLFHDSHSRIYELN